MQPNTSNNPFSEQILRQIAADARRALVRGRYCVERSHIEHLRCVDDQRETESSFGRQLWFFDGMGVNEGDRQVRIYGAVDYSLEYGLHELVEDGVFESSEQRNRYRQEYLGHRRRPSWRDPAHRLLLVGVVAMTLVFTALMLLR